MAVLYQNSMPRYASRLVHVSALDHWCYVDLTWASPTFCHSMEMMIEKEVNGVHRCWHDVYQNDVHISSYREAPILIWIEDDCRDVDDSIMARYSFLWCLLGCRWRCLYLRRRRWRRFPMHFSNGQCRNGHVHLNTSDCDDRCFGWFWWCDDAYAVNGRKHENPLIFLWWVSSFRDAMGLVLGLDSSFFTHRFLCPSGVVEQLMSLSSILARAMMEGVLLLFLMIAMLIAPRS